MALLEVKNIYKSFGGVDAIQDFSIVANAGEIHGIIGPNGAGKTTIFNTISGVYSPDKGQVLPGTVRISPSRSSTRSPAWAWGVPSRTSAFLRV